MNYTGDRYIWSWYVVFVYLYKIYILIIYYSCMRMQNDAENIIREPSNTYLFTWPLTGSPPRSPPRHSHSRLREDTMSVASSADDATIYGLGGFLGEDFDEREFEKESDVNMLLKVTWILISPLPVPMSLELALLSENHVWKRNVDPFFHELFYPSKSFRTIVPLLDFQCFKFKLFCFAGLKVIYIVQNPWNHFLCGLRLHWDPI